VALNPLPENEIDEDFHRSLIEAADMLRLIAVGTYSGMKAAEPIL
jgi:hypothetical protein